MRTPINGFIVDGKFKWSGNANVVLNTSVLLWHLEKMPDHQYHSIVDGLHRMSRDDVLFSESESDSQVELFVEQESPLGSGSQVAVMELPGEALAESECNGSDRESDEDGDEEDEESDDTEDD